MVRTRSRSLQVTALSHTSHPVHCGTEVPGVAWAQPQAHSALPPDSPLHCARRQSPRSQTLPTTSWRRWKLARTEAAQGHPSHRPPRPAPPPRARRATDLNSGSCPPRRPPPRPRPPSATQRWSWRRCAWSSSSRGLSTCTRRTSASGSTRR